MSVQLFDRGVKGERVAHLKDPLIVLHDVQEVAGLLLADHPVLYPAENLASDLGSTTSNSIPRNNAVTQHLLKGSRDRAACARRATVRVDGEVWRATQIVVL